MNRLNRYTEYGKIFFLRIMFTYGIDKAIEVQTKIIKMFAEEDIQRKFEKFFRET